MESIVGSNRRTGMKTKIAEILRRARKEVTINTRKAFQKSLEAPRKYNRICSAYDGIQPFLPFEAEGSVSLRDYLQMSILETRTFHGLLAEKPFIRKHCEVGKRFQNSIWEQQDFPEHLWESKATKELAELSKKS